MWDTTQLPSSAKPKPISCQKCSSDVLVPGCPKQLCCWCLHLKGLYEIRDVSQLQEWQAASLAGTQQEMLEAHDRRMLLARKRQRGAHQSAPQSSEPASLGFQEQKVLQKRRHVPEQLQKHQSGGKRPGNVQADIPTLSDCCAGFLGSARSTHAQMVPNTHLPASNGMPDCPVGAGRQPSAARGGSSSRLQQAQRSQATSSQLPPWQRPLTQGAAHAAADVQRLPHGTAVAGIAFEQSRAAVEGMCHSVCL